MQPSRLARPSHGVVIVLLVQVRRGVTVSVREDECAQASHPCPDPTLSQISDGRHVAQLLALLSEGEPTHEGWTGAVVRHCHKRGSAACAGAGAQETAAVEFVDGWDSVGFCNKILCD